MVNREVYKDAFAPPPPTRLAKAWERAPVSAHAPRLQGQKIWKKPTRKLRENKLNNENKENDVQAELEREGAGSRKRLRRGGEREDISNPKFMVVVEQQAKREVNENGVLSPVKKSLDTDAYLVPRKRTNANHLITPKKDLKRRPLADASPNVALSLPVLETSAMHEEMSAVPAISPAPKPERRRASMRQSRRLSRLEPIEDEVSPSLAVLEASMQLNMSSKEGITEVTSKPASSQPLDIFGTSSQQLLLSASTETKEETRISLVERLPEIPTVTVGEVVSEIEEVSTVVKIMSALPEKTTAQVKQQESTAQILEEDTIPTPVDDNVPVTETLVPTKTGETPKKKRASSRNSRTPQRSATRRSARKAPSSFAVSDAIQVQNVTDTNFLVESQGHATSPCRAERTPRARVRNITTPSKAKSCPEMQDFATAFEMPEITMNNVVVTQAAESNQDGAVSIGMQRADNKMENDTDMIRESRNSAEPEDIPFENSPEASPPQKSHLPPILEEEKAGSFEDTVAQAGIDSAYAHEAEFDISSPTLPEHDTDRLSKHDTDRLSTPPLADTNKVDNLLEASEDLEQLEKTSTLIEVIFETSSDNDNEDLPGSSTPDPNTTDLIETISEHAATVPEADTDLLRKFLTRVKANKAAKTSTSIPKRKTSLPHSPIQLPLGTIPATSSPSSPKTHHKYRDELSLDEFDVSAPVASPSKRRKVAHESKHEIGLEIPQPTGRSLRRNLRTRLPVKQALSTPTPSLIPLRRFHGQEDTTLALRKNEEKELATLTKFNSGRNKGAALPPRLRLATLAQEQEEDAAGPAAKHRSLKRAFEEKEAKGKAKRNAKTVVWAKELVAYQTDEKKIAEPAFILPPVKKATEEQKPKEEKKKTVKVGGSIRSKMSLGMANNGTPAPKRKRGEKKL